MTFFRREADRLDSYLDDHVAGRSADPDADGLDPALIETWTWATTAMAHTPSDPDAKSDTWRTIMHSHAIAAPFPATAPQPPARRHDELAKPRWSHRAMAFVGTAALAAGLAVGIAGFDRFGGGGSPNAPTSIPAASFFLPGTPETTGCDVPRREPGAIAQIMQTPPSQTPYFPRLNGNPLTDPLVGTASYETASDGTSLWMNSSPDDSVQTDIQAMLDTLFDCRAYALMADAKVDMEGPYFSLYSDDYFRRELNGFVESGFPLEINSFWLPSSRPVVVETRKLMDGDRYLVVLDESVGTEDSTRVLSVVPGEDGAWYVDEVGSMTEPQIDAEGTPIVAVPVLVEDDGDGAYPPADLDRSPHELTVSIADLSVANQNPWTCDMQDGTPIPCTSMGIYLMGPWSYNELLADSPFTYTFVNTSDVTTHISSPELGIDVTLPAGEQVVVEVEAEPGAYEIVFTQGDATSTRTFDFQPADGRFSMG